jgi:hypothetical protein
VRIDVEVVLGQYALTIHDCHIFCPNGNEVLNPDVGKFLFEKNQGFLAQLLVNAGLRIGGESRVQACACDEDILRLSNCDGPRLVTPTELIASYTFACRVARENTHDGLERSWWR